MHGESYCISCFPFASIMLLHTPSNVLLHKRLVERFPPHIRLTSAALGYDLAHCTASTFSPLVATLLVQNYSSSSPGVLYPFFAVLAVLGMFMSTKIHRGGGIGESSSVQMATLEGNETEKPQLNPVC